MNEKVRIIESFTEPECQKMSSAFNRIAKGGVVGEEEIPLFRRMSRSLHHPKPSNSCPQCWLMRVIRGKE